jgi:DNA-binding NarL/FixJ family response regulator
VAALRVVLADDNLLVRAGVEALLGTAEDVDIVAACSSLPELLEAAEREHPDVVLTDIRMPPTGTDEGIQAAVQLRRTHPSIGVVVLSQFVDPHLALTLMEHGTSRRGYLLKDNLSDIDQLLRAIHAVAHGQSFIDPLVIDSLVAARTGSGGSELSRLTPREWEILAEIASGKSNQTIAAELHVTDRAVEKHINSIFSKLDLSTDSNSHRRVKAVLLFLARGT